MKRCSSRRILTSGPVGGLNAKWRFAYDNGYDERIGNGLRSLRQLGLSGVHEVCVQAGLL